MLGQVIAGKIMLGQVTSG